MPAFEKIAREMEPRGVVFLGITRPQKEDPKWAKTRQAIGQLGLTFPTLVDTNDQATQSYGVNGLPHTVIIDRTGVVRGDIDGAQGEDALREQLAKAGA